MSSFYYSPTVHSVTDAFSNYSTGGNKYLVNEQNLNQFKSDTDKAFKDVSASTMNLSDKIYKLEASVAEVQAHNQQLLKSLNWIGANFPEAIEALIKTAKVAQKFDEADNQIAWEESEGVQAGP
jgi:hypothetical protein